ncbi:MAG: AMP-binding protein, partial [Solirubrobacteraceae bacterium]
MPTFTSYEQACAGHSWNVPERYNIAADICDRHPRDRPAMIHEDFGGNVRQVSWGELQDTANRFANVLVAHGVGRGDRVAMLLPPTPETAAAFFGTWKVGAILLSMSVLYGNEGIRHRLTDSGAKVLVTDQANADRIERDLVEHVLILDEHLLSTGSTAFTTADTAADDPAQLYYSSGTTGLAKGILHAHR